MRWLRSPGLQMLPLLLLLAVAGNQLRLVSSHHMSPWSGGGFGMFSTTDAATDRHLHVYLLTPGLRRDLKVPPYLEDAARRALTLPTEPQIRRLARELAEGLSEQAPAELEIQIWSTAYDPDRLTPDSGMLRSLRVDLFAEL